MKRDTIIETIALFFAVLFVYSSLEKIISWHDNMINFRDYPLLSIAPKIFTVLLPLSEMVLIYLLMAKRKTGLIASAITMIIFTGYILYMKSTMVHLPCPCGGFVSKLSWTQHIIFNSALTMLAGIAIYLDKSSSALHKKNTTIYNTSI